MPYRQIQNHLHGYSNRKPNLSFMPWAVKQLHKLEILRIKYLKTKNRDRKKANKQDVR